MSTATAALTYRRTRLGEWVAFGPAAVIRVGTVTVTKKDGSTKTEYVERLGRPFQAGGTECCYGYLRKTAPTASHGSRFASCGNCRCHREDGAGQPGSILFDGCDRCGCEAC